MRNLLITTAAIELGAGLALAAFPSLTVSLLLGSPLDAPAAVTLGRLTGAALFALGLACWLARGDANSRAARALVCAMLVYNIAAVALLAFAGLAQGMIGIALWPGVLLHGAMAAWCVVCLASRPALAKAGAA